MGFLILTLNRHALRKLKFSECNPVVWTAEYDERFEKNDFAYFSELIAVKKQLPFGGRGLEVGVQ
jgi:hypothetical protein